MNTSETAPVQSRSGSSALRSFAARSLVVLLCWGQMSPAWAVMAQVPLLTRTPSTTKPNVVFTFDDSGSMAWRFMPDDIWPQANDVRWSTAFHPSDDSTYGNGGSDSGVHVIPTRPNVRISSTSTVCVPDTQFTDCRASDLISARMRSAAYNNAYYNPEIKYEPWYNSNGSQKSNSPATGAWMTPSTSADPANLTGLISIPTSNAVICRSATGTTTNTTATADRNRTTPTCNDVTTLESPTLQTACAYTNGTWTGSACRFTSAQGATSGNCGTSYGGIWSSPNCDVNSTSYTNTTRGPVFCANRVSAGVWSSNACKRNEEFHPATYYDYIGDRSNGFNEALNYKRVRIADYTSFSRGAARTECAGAGSARTCTQAQEYQNYANWFTYYRTRNYLAIGASSKAFSEQDEALRIGYGRINKASGAVDGVSTATLQAGVRVFTGTAKDNFFTWLHTVPAASGTPLRRAMEDIGKYYMRADNNGPWSATPGGNDSSPHLACRKSYHILMTDGYWNGSAAAGNIPGTSTSINSTNVDNTDGPTITGPNGQSYKYVKSNPYKDSYSGTLADVAMAFWNRDLRTNLDNRVPPDAQNPAFWQHMVNFTVGLGLDGTLNFPGDLPAISAGTKVWPQPGDNKVENLDDLWHAAVNSRGDFLSAKNPAEFSDALSSFLNEITIRNASEGGVAATAATLQAGNRKYVPEYKTSVWTGNLTAYGLDEFGQQLNAIWNAAANVPAWNSRNILVGTGNGSPKAVPFTWANMGTSGLQGDMGGGSDTLVNYLRGDTTNEGTLYRTRAGKLGDFVNSQPVYVKSLVNQQYNTLPSGNATERAAYNGFLNDKAARPGIVLIGGNDGMLHAFRDSDGVEIFAFIPRAVLPNLPLLASPDYEHRYYVDGQLTEADAYIGGWKNLVLGSTGAGARSIFALEMNNSGTMNASNVLWELDSSMQADMGHVMAPIEVGLMKNGQWAAVFGNGPYSGSNTGNLFIVNLSNGGLIAKIPVTGTNNGLGGPRLIRDGNQVVVGAYAGDLQGNVWKFDLSGTSSGSWKVSFSGTPLYRAGSGKPIVAPPQFVSHPLGGQMVVVGTGKLYDEGDQSDNSQQSLYGLWDKQELIANATTGLPEWASITTTDAEVKDSQMVTHGFAGAVSGAESATYYTLNTQPLNWSIHRGWKLPLTVVGGQRNLVSPTLVFGYVLFETMSPTVSGVADPCEDSGAGGSYNLLLDPVNGFMPKTPLFDVNGDGFVNDLDTKVAGYKGTWDGRDVVLSQKACLTADDCPQDPDNRCQAGTKLVSIQSAVGGNSNLCLNLPPKQRWWWRQIQQIPE